MAAKVLVDADQFKRTVARIAHEVVEPVVDVERLFADSADRAPDAERSRRAPNDAPMCCQGCCRRCWQTSDGPLG